MSKIQIKNMTSKIKESLIYKIKDHCPLRDVNDPDADVYVLCNIFRISGISGILTL
jgi:hypothetical protein